MPSRLQSAYRNQQDDEYDSSEYCTATSDEESEDEVSVRNGIQFVKVLVRNTFSWHENNYYRSNFIPMSPKFDSILRPGRENVDTVFQISFLSLRGQSLADTLFDIKRFTDFD